MQDFRHKKANLFVFLCEILLFAQRCERIFEVERFHRFGVLEVLPKFWNMQDFRHKKANLFVLYHFSISSYIFPSKAAGAAFDGMSSPAYVIYYYRSRACAYM